MKDCILTCTIFYITFLTYLFMFGFTLLYSGDLKKFSEVLNEEQLEKYNKIRRERLHHFYSGLGVGGLLGLFVILTDFQSTSKHCLAGIVLILTTSCVYYVLPKSDYMLNHLDTEEQRRHWLNVSRNFVKKKIFAFLIVIVIYFCIPMIQ